MAQLLAPARAPASERISQILPSVKCSNCNQPVPLAELGDHVCAPLPPVPALPALKAPSSPRSVAALLPTRLQNLVSTPPAQSPPRRPSVAPAPPRQKSPAPPSSQPQYAQSTRRSRAPSSASSFSTRSSSERVTSPLSPTSRASSNGNGNQYPFPSPPGPSQPRVASPRVPDVPGALASRTSSVMDRSPTPGRTLIAAPGTTALRPRTPSTASSRPSGLTPGINGVRQPVQSSPAPYAPPAFDPRATQGSMSPPSIRQRAGTNASMRPDIVYSAEPRVRTPMNDPVGMRAPSSASMRPSMDQQRPPYMSGAPPPPSRTATPHIEPDTKTGGEAGMAGVGRRGFAAAARAAVFTSAMGNSLPLFQGPGGIPPQGMDGRRANAPRFLDIGSATNYAANTPPLSPGSGTASISPHSPYSQHSPVSPSARMSPNNITPTTPAGPGIATSPTSPVSVHSLRERVQEAPKPGLPEAPSTPRLPFFEKFKNKLPAVDTATPPPSGSGGAGRPPPSPTSDDGSYDGLAYANSDDDDDPVPDIPLRASPLPLATPAKSAENRVRFPSMTNSESKYSSASSSSSSSSTTSPRMPQRKLSSSTVGSSYSARTISKSVGALDRAMETLFEDLPTSPTTSTASARPFAPPPATVADAHRESVASAKSPKLPTRSHTSPTLPSAASAEVARRPRRRVCLRCEKHIEDGRWIQVEGANVLCDKCWKNMYLPKCRRCNKTIEKQAVSSSDGQLKGKYHKECFSCYTCEKPFPDKTFYVFDGRPYCAYHYHEENNSLCAAARCGQPIEGPCAVSHAGDRYHPEHLLCEYRGCAERLAEYYELDGRMLCERHVQRAIEERDADEDEDVLGPAGDRTTVALKRVTRFIDLAALGPVR